MAFKLNKTESKRKSELADTLTSKLMTFEEARASQTGKEDSTLSDALAEVLVALSETKEFVEEVASRMRDEYDEKSEKWQESDTASEIDEMINEWENADFEEPDLTDPGSLEFDNYAETLEELPEEVQ